jgi:hypothetical protein
MPEDIEEVLSAEGIHLFPRWRTDLTSRCTCPDNANPCKHVAAVHYVLARALDDDPFLLFALRGRPREALLGMLAAGRGGGGAAAASLDLSTLTPETYWDAPQPLPPMAFHAGDPAAAGDALAGPRRGAGLIPYTSALSRERPRAHTWRTIPPAAAERVHDTSRGTSILSVLVEGVRMAR